MTNHASVFGPASRLRRISALLYRTTYAALNSKRFFYVCAGLFLVQTVWVAISGAYSMAFDEYYHYGIIQLYHHAWLPFIDQPDGPAYYGAVARDPSFLYHYLLSFPHRVFALFTSNMALQVVFLRLLNTAMFAAGVFVFRKVLLELRLGKAAAHGVMAMFLLLPVSSQLAAQLNYDNMQFTIVALTIYISLLIAGDWQKRRRISLAKLLAWAVVVMAGCLVKFTFLPFALVAALFLAGVLIRSWLGERGAFVRRLRGMFDVPADARRQLWVLSAGALILFTLCVQRYGVNIINYQSLAPRCNAVLSHEACMGYDPYRRDNIYVEQGYHQVITADRRRGYPRLWFEQMVWETYFVVGNRQQDYPVGDPLPIAYKTGRVIAYILLVVLAAGSVYLLRTRGAVMGLCIGVIAVYCGVLYTRNYHDFMRVGVPVAIHARYLVPIFPLMGGLAVLALHPLLAKFRRARGSVFIMSVFILLFTVQGGGALPFVIRSNDSWMWPQMVRPNRVVRSVLWPLVAK